MNTELDNVIAAIGEQFKGMMADGSRHYREVNIGRRAEEMGYVRIKDRYRDAVAVVPLKQPEPGMKVRIDGRTFVNYAKFETGVVVPGYVARDASLPHAPFTPNDSMILNMT